MGFSWGTSLLNTNKDSTTTTTTTKLSMIPNSVSTSTTKCNKRSFHTDTDDENYEYTNNRNINHTTKSIISSLKSSITTTATVPQYANSTKRKYTYNSTHQTINTADNGNKNSLLISQNLPLSRSLNLLSKEQLCALIQNMVQEQPELTIPLQNNINQKLIDTVTLQDFINDLEFKFNKIIESIPYNKKYYDLDKIQPFNTNCQYRIMDLDDYSFTRLKPYILDFLNCLVDYILFNLPPIIKNFIELIKLLDSITLMCLNLPRFKLASNNYYYDKCWEQISFIWCSVINQLSNDPLLLNINDNNNSILLNWFNKLNDYNQLTNGMLNKPLESIKYLLLRDEYNKDHNVLSSFQQQQQQQQQNHKSFLSSAFTTNNNYQTFIPNFTTINETRTTTNTFKNNKNNNHNNNNINNTYVYSSSTLDNLNK